MNVYKSKNIGTLFSVAIGIAAIVLIAITLVYFRPYWYFLFAFITPFMLVSLVLPDALTAYYSIENGYLIKQYDKKNYAGKDTAFKWQLKDIIKVEKRKNIFGHSFIALYYSNNQSIDIYLKEAEIDSFIAEISQK